MRIRLAGRAGSHTTHPPPTSYYAHCPAQEVEEAAAREEKWGTRRTVESEWVTPDRRAELHLE